MKRNTLIASAILLASCIVSVFAAQTKRPDLESRIDSLIAVMTLDEKIGQMTQVDTVYIHTPRDISRFAIGSVFCGGGSGPSRNTPKDWADFIDAYQKEAISSRLGIPLLFGIDAVHGLAKVNSAVVFPHNIGMGCTRDESIVRRSGLITARECVAIGVTWTFAPCVAVARDERWGRTYESFGEDPELAASLGAASIRGYQGEYLSGSENVLACPKHYLGDGGTALGSGYNCLLDQGNTRISESEMRAIHLKPYISAVRTNAMSIMASYSSLNGVKMHANEKLLNAVLKEELGFRGFVVSDYKAIDQLDGTYEEQVAQAVNAGVDMVMVPDKYESFIEAMRENVESGKISITRLDDAVRRILRAKFMMNLHERPYANRKLLPDIGSAAHREVAREAVRKSVVLLKNENNVLPLSPKVKTIYVVGPKSDDIGTQCGGWTMGWQGSTGKITTGTSILEAIKKAAPPAATVVYSENGKYMTNNEGNICILVVGEKPYAEMFGDTQSPALSEDDITLAKRCRKSGIPTITILLSGRPVILDGILENTSALLAAWLPGTEGEGIADILFGSFSPSGKLSMSWPRSAKQIPINKGDSPYNPLFPYGYGLTYGKK